MLKDLILHLKELEELSSACNKCGMCQAVCPVFLKTGHEADVARGRLTLIDGLIFDILKRPEVVLDRLNKCLLCGSCSFSCSRKVKTLEIFIRARVIISGYSGLPFFKKILLQKIISKPVVLNKAAALLQRYQSVFFKSRGNQGGSVSARFYIPYLQGRNIQPIAPISFHSRLKETTSVSDKPLQIFFFAGCLIDKIMPETGISCVEALSYHGQIPHIEEREGCCGMPSLASGDLASFNRLVEHNAGLFLEAQPEHIITACATCTFTIRTLWPLIYKGPLQARVAEMASKTIDISQYIVNKSEGFQKDADPDRKEVSIAVTMHDPCHLKKSLGVYKEPRLLLKSIPGLTFDEMKLSDNCCGFGGTFSISHYDLSDDIGGDKCSNIIESGASVAATGCPACMIQLKDQLSKKGSDIRVCHFMDLYAESLPGLNSKN